LQKDLGNLKKGGVQLVAVSYDDVESLAKFGKKAKIGYALLSDPGSKTIGAYGIRNKEAKGSRIDGVPYPGTFLVGPDGIIREKLFYEGFVKRHQSKDILAATKKLPKPKKKAG
jgi:peroxiredoxin